jgi:SOS-response transcriptional repressor LexA
MKAIDEGIRRALKAAARDCGSVLGLSRRLGVSHSTVLFWSSGKTKSIDGDVWRYKVAPLLKSYIGPLAEEGRLGVASAPAMHEVPVIGLAQAAGFDPALEPFEAYARGCGEETAFFATEPKDGYFALKIEGRSMEPEFPDGTLILVAGGDFVQGGTS